MKKIGLFFMILLLYAGCGVKENPPDQFPPDINDVIDAAWEKYNQGEFSEAYALFDSAITLDSYDPRGYFGKGWSATQILKLDDAISSFSFTLILYGQRFETPIFNEVIPEDSVLYWQMDSIVGEDTLWHIKVRNKPLLAVTSINIKKGTKFVSPEIKDIDDSTALLLDFMPSLTDTLIDTIFINYYALVPSPPVPDSNVSLSYAGLTSSYVAKESYIDAIISGRALAKVVSSISFPYPPITMEKIRALVAYSAFKEGYMGLCVRILEEIDPDFIPPPNPYDPDTWGYIIEELEKFIGGT